MDGALWERSDKTLWRVVTIPTNEDFLRQYHQWVFSKVANRFRRNRDRANDTAQNVRLRLFQKDFIGRWFFKHLTHELVSRPEAERILGRDNQLKFLSAVRPVFGKRSEEDSLWRVSDLLSYAKFNHERYFYSIQDHTISSDDVLELLGYPAGKYNSLKSLYKQGRLRPAEFTQHECIEKVRRGTAIKGPDGETMCSIPGCGKKHFARGFCTTHYGGHVEVVCPACEKGRAALRAKKLSLADDWMANPKGAAQLRWNDSQLAPFLRQWRRSNLVCSVPMQIVRPADDPGPHQGIKAGLLSYANRVINNEVVNDFGRMTRTLDASCMVFNDGMSPESENADTVMLESDDSGENKHLVVKDPSALGSFRTTEAGIDLELMLDRADLSDEETSTLYAIDIEEGNVREFAEQNGVSIAHVHRVRNSAIEKMRNSDVDEILIEKMADLTCRKYGCAEEDMLGSARVGPCVLARAEFVHGLSQFGLSNEEISARTGIPKDRVALAVSRGSMMAASASR